MAQDGRNAEADASPGAGAWWLAAAAGLVGVLFGGAAVFLGLARTTLEPRPLPAPPPPQAPPSDPTPPAPAPQASLATLPTPDAPSLAQTVAATRDAVVNLSAGERLGAGVLVDSSGTILTNYHVIADALRPRPVGAIAQGAGRPTATARFQDGRELPALVLVADAEEDLAILRLVSPREDERFGAVTLGTSADLEVGLEVFAVGNPFGLNHTVTRGIVSALDRTGVLPNPDLPVIQLDASINVGNSGGPLFDREGQLVGLVAARSERAQGIAFAVPVDHLRGFLRAVADPHAARSGSIGVTLVGGDLPAEVTGLGYAAGLRVSAVEPGSPAQTAGLREDDVLVELRGTRLDGLAFASDDQALAQHVQRTVRSLFAGEALPMTVVRDGVEEALEVEIGAATPARQALIDAEELLGVRLAKSEGPPELTGFVPSSPLATYSRALAGSTVVRVMGRDVTSMQSLGEELSRLRALVRQRGRTMEVLISLREPVAGRLVELYVVAG